MSLDIAVIGSGVAGLSAAWILGEKNRVTLFEKKESLGLGYQGVEVETKRGRIRLDIPPRAINAPHYKHLFQLLAEINVETARTPLQPSFSYLGGDTYLGFHALERSKRSFYLPKLAPSTARWLWTHGWELKRWFSFIKNTNLDQDFSGISLRDFLQVQKFTPPFIDGILYPMWALMCTCGYRDLDRFPIDHMLRLFKNFTSGEPAWRIRGGTKVFEEKLMSRIDQCYFASVVGKLEQDSSSNKMVIHSNHGELSFDHVVIATEPQDAMRLLGDKWNVERDLISKVPWFETQMLMHTDRNLMPPRQGMWAPVNLFWDKEQDRSSATIWMNQIEQDGLKLELFQSWDPLIEPDPDQVLAKRTFKRSLATSESQKAMGELQDLMKKQKERKLWIVGSYLTAGVPLLENGVHSSKLVGEWIAHSSIN